MSIDWLIALALAFPVPLPDLTDRPDVLEAINLFLERHELADNDEVNQWNFQWVRRRALEVITAPAAIEADRLPSPRWLQEQVAFNRRHQRYLESLLQIDLHREQELLREIETNLRLRELYDTALQAATAWSVRTRRESLMYLRDKWPDFYHTGLFPPVVATWRFKEVTP